MSKNEFKQINVDNEIFKRIKKYKRTIYIISSEELSLQEKQKVIISNNKTNKKIKRKIVKVYPQNNLDELKKQLKKKSKYIYPTNIDNNHKITAVEFKYNKKIFRKILLFILLVFLSWFLVLSISNFISEMKDKKIKSVLNDLEKDKISYLFVEINPSFVLTVKGNIVTDIACLNDDCLIFYDDIDVKDKNINDSIDSLYNLSKEKGFNVSGGVKVKTTEKIDIKKEDYISVEYIDNNAKKELLSNIKNNEIIKEVNDNYYANLWEELKKDNDYGKVYECSMNNDELECYIKKDFVIHTYDDEKASSITDIVTITKIWSTEIIPNLNRLERVLKKFGVQVDADDTLGFMVNPIGYVYIDGVKYSTVILPQTPDEIEYDAKIKCDIYGFKLTDINLLKPNNTQVKILLEEDEIDYNINPIVIDIFDSFDCSDKYCKKITQRDEKKYICDKEYGEYMWHEEYKESGLIPIVKYEICDVNKSNCRVVSKNYFNNFSLEYGNLYDLPECKKDYTTRCNDMNYCYVNNSNSYCRSKAHLNGEWIAQGPNY